MVLPERSAPLEDDYPTRGGFVMVAVGCVPAIGDRFAHKDSRFEG